LIARGADVNNGTADGWTPLMAAAMKGDHQIATLLINAGANARLVNDDNGCNAFMYAAQVGCLELVRLLAPLSDMNAKSKDGWTSLMLASQNNHLTVISALLDEFQGVIINESDVRGFTALHYAAQEDHLDVVKVLLAHGANPNQVDQNGVTALHMVSLLNYLEMVKLLVNSGAQVNCKNATGATPLKIAKLAGNKEIVEFLLVNGAQDE
jgi:ankyrin repeat protein